MPLTKNVGVPFTPSSRASARSASTFGAQRVRSQPGAQAVRVAHARLLAPRDVSVFAQVVGVVERELAESARTRRPPRAHARPPPPRRRGARSRGTAEDCSSRRSGPCPARTSRECARAWARRARRTGTESRRTRRSSPAPCGSPTWDPSRRSGRPRRLRASLGAASGAAEAVAGGSAGLATGVAPGETHAARADEADGGEKEAMVHGGRSGGKGGTGPEI